jgi:hypothetical protein
MHPVWPSRLATRRAPRLAPSGTPFGHPVWPPRLATRRAPRLAIPSGPRRAPHPTPSGTPSDPVGHPVSHPVRPSSGTPVRPPSGTPSSTPVLSRGSSRPSIYEPLDRCPFGPPTVTLPFTYIKPSNPPLHHFLHSSICIGTCDCVATAALRGSWSLEAGSNCLGASPSSFFSSIYAREGWSLILFHRG